MCKCFFLGILGRSQSGNHPKDDVEKVTIAPKEDLAKSGYKPPKK
jgi:hypothetical protein